MSDMAKAAFQQRIHPLGESEESIDAVPAKSAVDTLAGKIYVFWESHAQVTALGPVAFFIEFLKTSGRWEKWVEDCPL